MKKSILIAIILIPLAGLLYFAEKAYLSPNVNQYSYAVVPKETYVDNIFKDDPDGTHVFSTDDLVFKNKAGQEVKKFDVFDLASPEIIQPVRAFHVPVQYSVFITPLKLSGTDFWGAVNLISSGDPPVNDGVSLFKINTKNWNIETYALPGKYINWLREQNLNLDKKEVLFEVVTPDNELYLYNYNLVSKSAAVIVAYPHSVFSQFYSGNQGFLGYLHPEFSGTASRSLDPKWLDSDTISYTDFLTRKEIIKKI